MVIKYYVFWIPTLYHVKNPTPIDTSVKGNISDNAAKKHVVTVSYLDNRNITIENGKGLAILEYINHSSNGLFAYRYSYDESDIAMNFISDEIPNAIYHLIKSLFHNHEHHDSKVDSLLRAFDSINESDVEIKEDNNKPLIHYLRLYEKKIQAYSDQLSFLFKAIQNNSKDKSRKYKLLENHTLLERMCQTALGEYVYCKTLTKSKYLVTANGSLNDNDEHRRMLLNIKNSIENIQLIQKKNQYELTYRCTKISFRTTEIGYSLSAFGLIMTIIGVYLTIKSFREPDSLNKIVTNQELMIDKINSLEDQRKNIANRDSVANKELFKMVELSLINRNLTPKK